MGQLQLLALAALLDGPNVISEFVGDKWPAECILPRFLMHFHLPKDAETFPSMLEHVLSGASVAMLSDLKADGEISSLLKRAKAVGVRGVVELGLTFCYGKLTKSIVAEIIGILERFAEKQLSESATSVEFRVVALRLVNECTITSSALDMLSQFLRTSNSLPLSVSDDRIATLEWAKTISGAYDERCCGRGSLVRYNEHISSVEIAITTCKFAISTAWLAFGFFHCDSASKVSSMSIRLEHSKACKWEQRQYNSLDDWMPVFLRVLSCAVSSEDLAPIDANGYDPNVEHALPTDRRVFVSLNPKTTARAQPKADAAVVAVLTEVTEYQVLRRYGNWIAIAIPGLGCGWVPNRVIRTEQTLESSVVYGQVTLNKAIKSFTYDTEHYNTVPITQLVSVIGPQLETLQLVRNTVNDDILAVCTNLRELHCEDDWTHGIAPLVSAFKTGSCAIQRLYVTTRSALTERTAGQLCEILSVKESRLQHLVVSDSGYYYEHELGELSRFLSSAISDSKRLDYFCVQCQGSAVARLTKVLKNSGPLSNRQKAAFLSVVHRNSTSGSALSRVDASILPLILRFAAPSHIGLIEILRRKTH